MKYNEICPKCGKRTLFVEGKATVISALRNEEPYSFVVKEKPDLETCWVRCGACDKAYSLSELEASEQVWVADVRVGIRAENKEEARDIIHGYLETLRSPFVDWGFVPVRIRTHSLDFGVPDEDTIEYPGPREVTVPADWNIENEEILEAFPLQCIETMTYVE